MKLEAILARARSLFLNLPDVTEVLKWGSPHIVVGEKILGGAHIEDGRVYISMKLSKVHSLRRRMSDERFKPAKYVGKHGWVTVDITEPPDWDDMMSLVLEGYRLVAPKSSVAKLDAQGPAKTTGAKKKAAKKVAAKSLPKKAAKK